MINETQLFKVSRPAQLRDYIEILKTINDEMTFHLTPEGLSVKAMDSTHVYMIEFSLPYEYFDIWNIAHPATLTFNLDEAFKLLKKLSKDDYLTVSMNDKQDKLTFTMRSDITRHKKIHLLEAIEEEIPTPKIYFKSKTRILLKTLRRIINDFKDSPHTTFKTTRDFITFSTTSDEFEESTPIDGNNDSVLEHRVEEEGRTVITTEYLHKFLSKAVKVSEVVNIHLSEEMPIKLDVELPQGSMIYYLAPCIGV